MKTLFYDHNFQNGFPVEFSSEGHLLACARAYKKRCENYDRERYQMIEERDKETGLLRSLVVVDIGDVTIFRFKVNYE